MARSIPIESMQIAATTSDQTQNLGGAQQIYVSADAAIYVDFDQPIATTQSFKLPANTPLRFDFRGASVQNIHVQAVTGTTTAYIISTIN